MALGFRSFRPLLRILLLWVVIGTAHAEAFAQSRSTPTASRSLSLSEALRLAQERSDDLEAARATERARSGQLRSARSGYFPSLAASASYERTLASEFDEVFDAPAGEGAPAAFEDLPFGRANTYRFGFALQQNLYAGGRTRAGTQQASAARDSARLGVTSARGRAVLDTAQAYYDAVLADRFVAIAEATLDQAEQTLADVRLNFEAGARPEFDLLRARVTVDAARPAVIRERTARSLAYLRLKQLLDVPEREALVLTSPLEAEQASARAEAQSVLAAHPAGERAAVRQARLTLRSTDAAVTGARAGYLPSLDATMTYGRVAYPDDLTPGWSEFRTNWVAGISLSWTLFDGLRTSGSVQSAEAAREEAAINLRRARKAAAFELAEARQQLDRARAVFDASASAVEQARRAHEIATLRYREGVSTQLELLDARLQFEQAEVERARAARDLQVARMRLVLLPVLPLSGAPSGALAP